ncbi:MAG: hypothetical protein E6I56_00830 [Chloroflexi bacterium]|nr:MAG: hypothetical protein E6I56_00830 [Chloroflexota bacterium]
MSALGFSNDLIGLFNSLPALVLLGIGLPLAGMADRIGYRLFLMASGALAVAASIVLALAGQRLIAVLASGSFALALAVLEVLGAPLLAQVSDGPERVSLFAELRRASSRPSATSSGSTSGASHGSCCPA